MIPGTTYLPVRSTKVVSGRAAVKERSCGAGRISTMRPPSITIVTLACGGEPVPSMTVAFVRMVTWAAALVPSSAAATRPSQSLAYMIVRPLH